MPNLIDIVASEHTFANKVISIAKLIPKGKVLGYGHLAALAGKPRNARQVGTILKASMDKDVPWWRVLRSDGSIAMQGDITRGPLQIQHLRDEKVLSQGTKVDIQQHRWQPEIT